MITPHFESETLILHIEGIDKVWALKSQLTIPYEHITGVRIDTKIAKKWWHGFKAPGTQLPGVITAGTFYQDGKRVFWDVHHPEKSVIISLKDEKYAELVIEVENPDLFVTILKAKI
jgi:hypothetical protein